jgi:hypothetical protein
MRNFEASTARLFTVIAGLATCATALAGCGTYGDPCLRTTDCGSGFVCVEGRCQVDLGDNPGDAAVPGDAPVTSDTPGTGDSTSSDAPRDASVDPNTGEGSAPPSDSAGADAPRDGVVDGDGTDAVETSALDGAEVGTSLDASDARAATDTSSGNSDAIGGDVGADADSGSVIDVTVDALDAAG